MNVINQPRGKVYSTTNAPRELLVAYIKELVKEAKRLPSNEREMHGDYANPTNRFPQTKGEDIASDIQSCLGRQDWVGYDTADDLEEICEIAGNLEVNTDDHELWRKLFEKADKLTPRDSTGSAS